MAINQRALPVVSTGAASLDIDHDISAIARGLCIGTELPVDGLRIGPKAQYRSAIA